MTAEIAKGHRQRLRRRFVADNDRVLLLPPRHRDGLRIVMLAEPIEGSYTPPTKRIAENQLREPKG